MGEHVQVGPSKSQRNTIRVLHVKAKSMPELNGYSIRGHEIIRAQLKSGDVYPTCITSPFYPSIKTMQIDSEIEGVRYTRSLPFDESKISASRRNFLRRELVGSRFGSTSANSEFIRSFIRIATYPARMFLAIVGERIRSRYFQKCIEEEISETGADIVHAHTPYKVGIPALRAARKKGKKFVYEVRGIWEESAIARGKFSKWGARYWRFRFGENRVIRSADRIFCINELIKDDLISRGVDRNLITVILNGARESMLSEGHQNQRGEIGGEEEILLESIKKARVGAKIVGYIGSVQRYEGLDLLANAVKKIIDQGEDAHLLLISNTGIEEDLRRYLRTIGMEEYSTFCGPISREVIPRFYREIDVIVIPRVGNSRMAELVTPLKPLEPIALGVPLIVSDAPAMMEVVSHDTATIFESGNVNDLVDKIRYILLNQENAIEKSEKGKKWLAENATWEILARKTIVEYRNLLDY